MTSRRADDRVRLLHGPYQTPRLHVGDRATCLFKDCDVTVTGWTDAPLAWPRCLPVGRKGHPSLLVNEELARAVRLESAAAVMHWWGVSVGVVWRWRKALSVTRTNNEGSQRLIRAASEAGASTIRAALLPPEQVERRRRTAVEQNLGRNLITGYHGRRWTDDETALLGKLPDAEVAERTGFKMDAVRQKRESLSIPNPTARPGTYGSPPWAAEEDEVLRELPPQEAARRLGRTMDAVYGRRSALGAVADETVTGRGRRRRRMIGRRLRWSAIPS